MDFAALFPLSLATNIVLFLPAAGTVWMAGARLVIYGDKLSDRFGLSRAFIALVRESEVQVYLSCNRRHHWRDQTRHIIDNFPTSTVGNKSPMVMAVGKFSPNDILSTVEDYPSVVSRIETMYH